MPCRRDEGLENSTLPHQTFNASSKSRVNPTASKSLYWPLQSEGISSSYQHPTAWLAWVIHWLLSLTVWRQEPGLTWRQKQLLVACLLGARCWTSALPISFLLISQWHSWHCLHLISKQSRSWKAEYFAWIHKANTWQSHDLNLGTSHF